MPPSHAYGVVWPRGKGGARGGIPTCNPLLCEWGRVELGMPREKGGAGGSVPVCTLLLCGEGRGQRVVCPFCKWGGAKREGGDMEKWGSWKPVVIGQHSRQTETERKPSVMIDNGKVEGDLEYTRLFTKRMCICVKLMQLEDAQVPVHQYLDMLLPGIAQLSACAPAGKQDKLDKLAS
ncbi:hypothetical protein EDB84DRAFT_1442491 [Lactarius hengduanensis]|nr:hypothetical protein EDB84DRAFT_1442491 [Lactarius hengduanensis]